MKASLPEIPFSEPVKDIMGSPPQKIVRWGTGIIGVVFLLFVLFAWFLKYPDVIPSPVEITTENPPVILVARISGKIKNLYVEDNSRVKEGQIIAAIETAASLTDIGKLKSFVDTLRLINGLPPGQLPELSELGELQEVYQLFIKSCSAHFSYLKNDFYGNKISSVNDEIAGLRSYLEKLKVKERLFNENLLLEKKKFQRDSLLNDGNVIPDSDLENSQQAYLMQKIELQQVKLDYSSKQIELAAKQQLLQDYIIRRTEETEALMTDLTGSLSNLRAEIDIWEKSYLLISPVEGTTTFTKFWSVNQTVEEGEPVLGIVPVDQGAFLGRMNLKMQRSGKVKVGQSVNIKLSGYPYLEYGIVRGIVKTKSLVPDGNGYVLDIELPAGLTTLYGKELVFSQNMSGTAEIVTDDTRLLQKIFNPFRYIISKNRN